MQITKFDNELQVVYGEVYAPDRADTDNQFMTTTEVRKAAHSFVKNLRMNKIDTNHDFVETGAYVVESFIARKNDTDFIPGAWVIGVKVPDDELWNAIKSGELNGFSLAGQARTVPSKIQVDIPDVVVGKTVGGPGHTHTFNVQLDDRGNLVAGQTDIVDGHYHTIKGSTVTEEAGSPLHTHRFSYTEELNNG